MVVYDEQEQERLIKEYKDKMLEAYKTYAENIEELYNYGCNKDRMIFGFIAECVETLNAEDFIKVKQTKFS